MTLIAQIPLFPSFPKIKESPSYTEGWKPCKKWEMDPWKVSKSFHQGEWFLLCNIASFLQSSRLEPWGLWGSRLTLSRNRLEGLLKLLASQKALTLFGSWVLSRLRLLKALSVAMKSVLCLFGGCLNSNAHCCFICWIGFHSCLIQQFVMFPLLYPFSVIEGERTDIHPKVENT